MSDILYYSRYCKHSQRILSLLSKSSFQDQIHFICIDKRIKQNDGSIHILLENGQTMILPPNVLRVPALLLLNRGYEVLYGDHIMEHYRPSQEKITGQETDEPMAFALSGYGSGIKEVVSDSFSYLETSAEDLLAKGNGGMAMMNTMNYCTIDDNYRIETPPDTYQPDKIGDNTNLDQIRQQRDQDVPQPQRRM